MASKDDKKSGKSGKGAAEKPATAKKPAADLYRIPRDSGWARAARYALVVFGVGALMSGFLWSTDSHRFAFSWLFAVMTFLALSLGSMFLLLFQHITMGHWGIVVRRTHETFATGVTVIAVFVVPLMLMHMDDLYPWMPFWRESVAEHHEAEGAEHGEAAEHSSVQTFGSSVAHAQDRGEPAEVAHGEHHTPQHAAHEETMRSKLGYLNQPFFWGRMFLYIAIWIGISWYFHSNSVKQDVSRDKEITKRLNKASPAALAGLALSLTFAAFDWVMSLEPTWFSTIFGVQYFAVSLVSSLAVCIVVTRLLQSSGLLGGVVTTEHYHDMGKLLFGFLVFWAYITFSQFMLIWYASIPEETTYFHLRFSGGWRTFSWFLLIFHFFVPFFGILSRNIKRNVSVLAIGAGWLLVMHVFEMFWLIMPYVNGGAAVEPSVGDLSALMAVGGAYFAFVFWRMSQNPLIPVGDPRLAESLHHEVV